MRSLIVIDINVLINKNFNQRNVVQLISIIILSRKHKVNRMIILKMIDMEYLIHDCKSIRVHGDALTFRVTVHRNDYERTYICSLLNYCVYMTTPVLTKKESKRKREMWICMCLCM